MENNLIVEFFKTIFSGNTGESKESLIAISRLLSKEHLDKSNAFLFLKIINLNIKESSDIIFSNRNPESFFSNIIPCNDLLIFCVNILTKWRPKELYFKNILSCLGILQMTFKNAKYGFNVYKLSIADIQHIGKYLINEDEEIKNIIIDILNDIWKINYYKYKDISIKAKEIIDCYFDKTKKINDVIPDVLII